MVLAQMDSAVNSQAGELRQIFDAVPLHISILDTDWTTTFANQSARDYLGSQPAESSEDFITDSTHPDDRDKLEMTHRCATANNAPARAEARVRGKDGTYRWFLHHLLPLHSDKGGVASWCVLRVDINDQKVPQEQEHRENIALKTEIEAASMFEEIVGTSQPIQAAISRVIKVAQTDATVMITGETGTGKELIARAIHKRSSRANKPFVSVNCAAIPRDLIASELFGHEKGAFTGALQRRLGRFELAEGGTIFLDEIGELPAETQVALLRVLQEREFQRVGGNFTVRADVRIIVATHRDLPEAIANGTFRADLFYRINVFPIQVPALRERKNDIQLLVKHFVDQYASKAGKKIKCISWKSMERMLAYSWPGNIRELQNVIERSVVLCEGDEFSLDESWLWEDVRRSKPMTEELVHHEKEMIESVLYETKGRVSGPSGAAVKLGLPPSTLDSKIKTLKINKSFFQTA
jgi:PAS domain S-box-containing protein